MYISISNTCLIDYPTRKGATLRFFYRGQKKCNKYVITRERAWTAKKPRLTPFHLFSIRIVIDCLRNKIGCNDFMFFFHKKSPNWISGNQYRRPQIENIDVLLFGAYIIIQFTSKNIQVPNLRVHVTISKLFWRLFVNYLLLLLTIWLKQITNR